MSNDAGYANTNIPIEAITMTHEDSSPVNGTGESGALSLGILGEFHPPAIDVEKYDIVPVRCGLVIVFKQQYNYMNGILTKQTSTWKKYLSLTGFLIDLSSSRGISENSILTI